MADGAKRLPRAGMKQIKPLPIARVESIPYSPDSPEDFGGWRGSFTREVWRGFLLCGFLFLDGADYEWSEIRME